MKGVRKKTYLLIGLVALLVLVIAVPAVGAKDVLPAKDLKKITLIHYAKDGSFFDKPPWAGKPSPEEPPAPVSNYYELLGYKWSASSLPVTLALDPDGAPAGTATQMQLALNAWDTATSSDLFVDNLEVNSNVEPSLGAPDGVNSISFRFLAGYPKALAVTNIWYDPSTGFMVDTDLVFNTKYDWAIDPDGEGGATLAKRQYDVRNVGTHEVGHIVGLDDLYPSEYRELSMYGYSEAKETKKNSLEQGDILGTQVLYGS